MDLCTASALGLHDFVQESIKRNSASILEKNRNGWTPLMYACFYCQEHIVSLIVNSVPSSIYSINQQMQTPLMMSCISGNLKIVQLLTEAQPMTKKEIIESKDKYGLNALFYATIYGHTDVICYLIRNGANINARDYSSCTVLMTAVKEDKENVVELLLGFGADQEMRTNNGLKAVDLAFEMKHFKLMNLLSTAVTDLEGLLHSLCLDKYTNLFKEKNIDLMQLLKFNEDDLKQIGMVLLGPRRKLSLAISKLNHLNDLKLRLQDEPSI